MLNLTTLILVGLAAFVLVIAYRAASRYRNRPQPASEYEFDPCHKGKEHEGGCKYNKDEQRRSARDPRPPMDLGTLDPKDPFVQKVLACINEAELKDLVSGISGEKAVYVGDNHLQIKSRSSYGQGVYQAMTWCEQFYRAFKKQVSVRRVPYQVRGKTYYNLEAKLERPVPMLKWLGQQASAAFASVRRLAPSVLGVSPEPKKKRVFIWGAHIDSTAGNTWGDEKIAPGADDDGSGTILLLKLCEALLGFEIPEDVEIRFVHFTGEEQGLWGSYKYADQCKAAGDNIVCMWQSDMIGYCRNKEHRVDIHDNVDQNGSHKMVVEFFRAVAQYGLNLKPFDTHNRAVENRSDHAGFLDQGWMAVLVSEEFTDEGFTPYYHTKEDRVDKFNMPYYAEIIRAMIVIAVNMAGLKASQASAK
ncbi:MAG: M28 family peptidase [Candidatus Obscuribacterales bacterium]|nr:M28 family peptidase [Candidatus Obscuribacterales bacterium]